MTQVIKYFKCATNQQKSNWKVHKKNINVLVLTSWDLSPIAFWTLLMQNTRPNSKVCLATVYFNIQTEIWALQNNYWGWMLFNVCQWNIGASLPFQRIFIIWGTPTQHNCFYNCLYIVLYGLIWAILVFLL